MTDAVVIGGGVIGLSITRALCKSGLDTILFCLLYTSPSPRDP